MDLDSLAPSVRSAIDDVVRSVRDALSSAPSEHLSAVSTSFLSEGYSIDDSINGGDLAAPSPPQFKYDKARLLKAHQQALRAANSQIRHIIVRAARPETSADWALAVKLVSQEGLDRISDRRSPFDTSIKSELLPLLRQDDRFVSLIFDSRRPLRLVRRHSKLEEMEPTVALKDLLSRVVGLYDSADLRLVRASWRVEGADFSSECYFE